MRQKDIELAKTKMYISIPPFIWWGSGEAKLVLVCSHMTDDLTSLFNLNMTQCLHAMLSLVILWSHKPQQQGPYSHCSVHVQVSPSESSCYQNMSLTGGAALGHSKQPRYLHSSFLLLSLTYPTLSYFLAHPSLMCTSDYFYHPFSVSLSPFLSHSISLSLYQMLVICKPNVMQSTANANRLSRSWSTCCGFAYVHYFL